MTTVTHSQDSLEIAGEMVELPETIETVVQTDDVVLVQFTEGEMDPRNLVAFDLEGEELWRVSPLRKNENEGAKPVGGMKRTDEFVELGTRPGGQRYKLDVETGEVEYLG